MTRSFLVPVIIDVVTAEELALTASEIQDAVEAAGFEVDGEVKPWTNPTLQTSPVTLAQPAPTPPVVTGL